MMATYKVVVEAPGFQETHEFDAESLKEAEEMGKDIFFDICNYGVSPVDED
ncbi:hypothetical protein JNA99_07455 [Klebsiella oxytoca]|uniref:hypothetical protein n=1 Tax=Klebsiella oxytoca TaxID=571 RepID=UPI00192DBEDC|nr:hypothetical protein [Klebsiella oxytoca]MBL5997466.1 hypothetical protein [Klebsiella oxytoca]MBL6213327.1 hypothetical protein [Klebsiella oxytoca]UHC78635.1 hypothetical protein LUW97_12695 [Klebsiella oxytoca]UHC95713.1 hypothetical protein LUW98_12695 [Klebsiella oxytoca]HBV5156016.1 hypothetical protein [Klebsiella oxytoca]